MIRIVLVDDHALVRSGFRMILAQEADMEIVGEAANGEDALKLARQLAPDVEAHAGVAQAPHPAAEPPVPPAWPAP